MLVNLVILLWSAQSIRRTDERLTKPHREISGYARLLELKLDAGGSLKLLQGLSARQQSKLQCGAAYVLRNPCTASSWNDKRGNRLLKPPPVKCVDTSKPSLFGREIVAPTVVT